jgi:hypothetical protein
VPHPANDLPIGKPVDDAAADVVALVLPELEASLDDSTVARKPMIARAMLRPLPITLGDRLYPEKSVPLYMQVIGAIVRETMPPRSRMRSMAWWRVGWSVCPTATWARFKRRSCAGL